MSTDTKKHNPSLMSPYGSVRLQANVWYDLAIHFAKNKFVTANGMIAGNVPDIIMSDFIIPAMNMLTGDRADEKTRHADTLNIFENLLRARSWVPLAAQYELSGKQIFDLGDDLVQMFVNTDIKDTTLTDLRTPYDAFFIRFGRMDDIKLPWNDEFGNKFEYLDGAFVATSLQDDGRKIIKIGFTTVLDSGVGVGQFGHFVDIQPDEQLLPVRDGIKAALTRKINEIKANSETGDNQIKALNHVRLEVINENFELLERSINLIVTALFYLEEPAGKSVREPGRDTPPSLDVMFKNALLSNIDSKIISARKKVNKDGYVIVNMVGHDIEIEGKKAGIDSGMSLHWRRGHYRDQPYGKGRLLTRRLWLKPTLIGNKKEYDEVSHGHIYRPSPSDNSH